MLERAWAALTMQRREALLLVPASVTPCAMMASERASAWLLASAEEGGMRSLAAELRALEGVVQDEALRVWVRETARLVGRVLAGKLGQARDEAIVSEMAMNMARFRPS